MGPTGPLGSRWKHLDQFWGHRRCALQIRSHTRSALTRSILGMDMANAFLEFLAGKEFAAFIRSGIELGVRNSEDDEFAAVHGLV